MNLLWVGLGSGLGGVLRYAIAQQWDSAWPWGTLLVNVVGCLAIGLLAFWPWGAEAWLGTPQARLFLMVGLLGGFTTFSAFSLQTLQLFDSGGTLSAVAYAAASVLGCLLGAALGRWLASLA